ncbi:MAG: leucine-rich repeat protein, partial [Clostridia bacterium]|nr:leucine-rich repeat protein [Clostridia bacterium]
EGCESLISINIPDSVLSIGECAFFGCSNLTNITISDRVIEIYGRTFLGCKSLANKGDFLIVNNILYNYAGNAASVNIPDGVTTIGYSAFNSCESLISINIPNSVTDIGLFAFDQCTNLQRINIPASVTYIGLFAFSDCSSLTDVYYGADEISWKNIEVDSNNECLQTANIHFTEPDKSEIKVTLYGKKLSFDQPPVIENGRTLVPLRAIFEALDAEVTWENGTRTVRATRDGTYIELQIDSNEMKVNTQIITLDVPAKIINDRTMVPARAVAEAFGCNVSWDAENNAVIIN